MIARTVREGLQNVHRHQSHSSGKPVRLRTPEDPIPCTFRRRNPSHRQGLVFDDFNSQVREFVQESPEVRNGLQLVQTRGACMHHQRPNFAARLGSGVNHVKGDWEVYEVVFPKRAFAVFVIARLWPKDSEEILVGFLLELGGLVLLSHDVNPCVRY
jgi:hypothetical protein